MADQLADADSLAVFNALTDSVSDRDTVGDGVSNPNTFAISVPDADAFGHVL